MKLLEICCFGLEPALLAQQAGAQRIEYCADPAAGGTTPSPGMIEAARDQIRIPLFPIIRPRGGDFLYSAAEFQVMKRDIRFCRETGCEGIVTGILQEDGSVDRKRMAILMEAAYPLSVCFHRAFDWTRDPFVALEDIISLGCERVLTSGQQARAEQGSGLLRDLVSRAAGRITIMPGSGIRAGNIRELALQTGAEEFHSSARAARPSAMAFTRSEMGEDQSVFLPDEEEIRGMLTALKDLG